MCLSLLPSAGKPRLRRGCTPVLYVVSVIFPWSGSPRASQTAPDSAQGPTAACWRGGREGKFTYIPQLLQVGKCILGFVCQCGCNVCISSVIFVMPFGVCVCVCTHSICVCVCMSTWWCAVYILYVYVCPFVGDRVQVEESGAPRLVSTVFGLIPLSLLQYELLLGCLVLVTVHYSTGHMLPQPARHT